MALFNLSSIREVNDNDPEKIKRMLRMIHSSIEGSVIDLSQTFTNSNWTQLSKVAHKSKSTAKIIESVDLLNALIALEKNSSANVSITEIKESYEKSLELLTQINNMLKEEEQNRL